MDEEIDSQNAAWRVKINLVLAVALKPFTHEGALNIL